MPRTSRQPRAHAFPKTKGNAPMPPLTQQNIERFADALYHWRSSHRAKAVAFMERVGPDVLFAMLHSMRRWYSGQTMAGNLVKYRNHFAKVMRFSPLPPLYRGFKVPRRDADLVAGTTVSLDVTRNRGISSWTIHRPMADRFSGASRDRVGVVIQLAGERGVQALLAPPKYTEAWFNALYEAFMGSSFRPGEGEYVLRATRIRVRVLRIKR